MSVSDVRFGRIEMATNSNNQTDQQEEDASDLTFPKGY